jgi:hypothetical protein
VSKFNKLLKILSFICPMLENLSVQTETLLHFLSTQTPRVAQKGRKSGNCPHCTAMGSGTQQARMAVTAPN